MTKEEAIKFLQQIYPNGGHCWLDEQRIEAINMAIDALKEEPVSMWHDASEEPKPNMELICVGQYGNPLVLSSNSDSFKERYISKWAYFNDLLNLSNAQRTTKDCKEPVSEDLEEAAKNAGQKYFPDEDNIWARPNYEAVKVECAFKAGAQWQKQQDQSTIELAEDHAMLAGMEKMKEQMMANAVEGVVHHFEKCKVASVHYNDPTGVPMAYFTSPEGLSAGDKVKIIVIKGADDDTLFRR